MNKFLIKSIFFLIPLLSIPFIELFILPIDFFTFRAWEALVIKGLQEPRLLQGQFYPNIHLKKLEAGDLAPNTIIAEQKMVEWFTDRYGYRKENSSVNKYHVVIVGDSFTAGSGLTQKDILSEQLENQLNIHVYPFAPSNLYEFWKDSRFRNSLPDVVILESAERLINDLPIITSESVPQPKVGHERFYYETGLNPFFSNVAIIIDRLYKQNMFNYISTILNGQHGRVRGIPAIDESMLFRFGKLALEPLSSDIIEKNTNKIVEYDKLFKERGISFIFLPIPNKENIYYDLVQDGKKSSSLKELITKLQSKNVSVIDLQPALEQSRKDSPELLLYQKDDTHWTQKGVSVSVDLIMKQINKSKVVFN